MRGRRPATRPEPGSLHALFLEHAKETFKSMRDRFGPKKVDGRITSLGRELPFDLIAYKEWVLVQFQGSWNNRVQCAYCSQAMHVGNYVIDHITSIKQGGTLELENLALACESCNTLKGQMSAPAFTAFIGWCTANLHPMDYNDIFGRMKNGGRYLGILVENARKAKIAAAKRSGPRMF